MIEWIEYDPNSRDIESHVTHLITDGQTVQTAQHAKYLNKEGYGWHIGMYPFHFSATHWARINLPFIHQSLRG